MSEKIQFNESESRNVIKADTMFEFEERGLKGDWQKITMPDGKSVEGAYYQPVKSNGEVVIFHPGMPGGVIEIFEDKFVSSLLSQGYEVFAARHNGLKNQEDNADLFHNEKRINQDQGISGSTLTLFTEPRVSISYFAQQEKPITLITHSFSGIAAANSFIEMAEQSEDNPAKFVKKWILASASIWEMGDDGMLDPDRWLSLDDLQKYCEYFATKYSISESDGANKLFEKLKTVLGRITSNIGKSMPETTEVIGIYPSSDKLVDPQIGISFINKLPRGIILRDNYAPTDSEEDPHDFEHAKASDLLRIMQMHTSKVKHTFNINKKNEK